MNRRRSASLIAALALCTASIVFSQPYPNRPLRVIVNFPAGGNVDNLARLQIRQMEALLGQVMVVDNRPGANGIIGAEITQKAAANGYTLLFTPSSIVVNQVVYPKIPYDVRRDFAPISNAANATGYLLVVNPSVNAQSIRDFVALAKNRDKPVTYGTPGIVSVFLGEMLNINAGTRMLNVPYKGVPQVMTAVLGGEINAVFMQPLAVAQHIKEGKLRALAFTGAKRWEGMPELPTFAESILPGVQMPTSWQGWFAPAGTPPEIIGRLNREIRKALEAPKVREIMAAGGFEPVGDSPADFRKTIDAELRLFTEISAKAKIKME